MNTTIVPFDQAKRNDQVIKGKRVQEAMTAFAHLMEDHGCNWVSLNGKTPDGRFFAICSGKLTVYDHDGVNINHPDRKGGAA